MAITKNKTLWILSVAFRYVLVLSFLQDRRNVRENLGMERRRVSIQRNALMTYSVGLEWVVWMLLEEDRGSERQRCGYGGVGEWGVEGGDVECVCAEEFGDGVGEGRDGELGEGGAGGPGRGAQGGEGAPVGGVGAASAGCARARDQQLRRMDRVRGVPDAAGAGRHGGS